MDEPRQPSVEMPELLRDLAELKERAKAICFHLTPNGQFELMAIDTTTEIIIKIIRAVEMRNLEELLRHQDRAIALDKQRREPWE